MYGDYSTQTLRLGHTFFKTIREMEESYYVIVSSGKRHDVSWTVEFSVWPSLKMAMEFCEAVNQDQHEKYWRRASIVEDGEIEIGWLGYED